MIDSFYANREELDMIIKRHWEEATDKSFMPNIDWERYLQMERNGLSFAVIERVDGEIAGYLNMIICPHLHYKHLLFCTTDMIYVKPKFRGRMMGIKMLKEAERFAKRRGDVVMQITDQEINLSPLAKRMGYEMKETIYRKTL